MFAIGEAESNVSYSKLRIPKEYNLRKRNRKIYGAWLGDRVLYLSDEIPPLKAKAGRNSIIFEPSIDSESRIDVPAGLEKCKTRIRGCITTIEVEFEK